MREYEIVDVNAENLGGCGFCGRRDPDNEGYRRKSEWLKKRYVEGFGANMGSNLRISDCARQPKENARWS